MDLPRTTKGPCGQYTTTFHGLLDYPWLWTYSVHVNNTWWSRGTAPRHLIVSMDRVQVLVRIVVSSKSRWTWIATTVLVAVMTAIDLQFIHRFTLIAMLGLRATRSHSLIQGWCSHNSHMTQQWFSASFNLTWSAHKLLFPVTTVRPCCAAPFLHLYLRVPVSSSYWQSHSNY